MSVKLHAGWAWDCPKCDHRNITYGDFEPDEETLAQAKEQLGEHGVTGCGQLVCVPDEVTCAKCLNSEQAEEPHNWLDERANGG